MHPNVLEHLQRAGIAFILHEHARSAVPIRNPADFARSLGYPVERILKSLLLTAGPERHVVAVCAVNKKVDFSQLSKVLQWGRLEVASAESLQRLTDYPARGVSPLGLSLPVVMDREALRFETVCVGAGQAGVELEIAPPDLVAATSATVVDWP